MARLDPSLDRPFRLIAFDWDGTAVAGRTEDSAPIRGPIQRLLRCGVLIVVISGTNLGNIDRQLARAIVGRHKRNLFIASDRGSEVHGFDASGQPVRLWRRQATADEEQALTATAEALRDQLSAPGGLDVRVIYDRLNRRKVDLIPVDRWRDPPKSEIGDLLVAVDSRLKAGGIAGGIAEALALAQMLAREHGLADARITTDVKHVEIGLTDKADSMAWVTRDLAGSRNLIGRDLLVGGDEFGPIAGFPGSDSRMLAVDVPGAMFVSVGPEPGGVPPGVLHLGGGPARFRELLAGQAALHPVQLPVTPTAEPGWRMVEEGFLLPREHEIESLFAIGNGLVGTRGSLAEGSPLSAPATVVAGVFRAEPGTVATLAHVPDWAEVSGTIDGARLRVEVGEQLENRRILDLRQGILWREWRHRDEAGRITCIRAIRLASLADRHVLLQSITLTPENYSSAVVVGAPMLSRPVPLLTISGTTVGWAVASLVEDPEGAWMRPAPDGESDQVPEQWMVDIELGKTYRLDRVLTVHTSRDSRQPLDAARDRLRSVADQGLDAAVWAHCDAWRERWQASDVVIDGDADAQLAVRFAIYHLISAANPDDDRISIGARALTGPSYGGHVFWDTEIYMLPFFTLTWPEAARALLMYRLHTLPAARARAARVGCRGALYAWESADTGEDVTPSMVVAPDGELIAIRVAEEEQHISADVAYAVWNYWLATGDEGFLREAGVEILVETARFWASRAHREEDGRWHIRGVIGPDEYHESVDDDAYTNGMAQWNLEVAAEAARLAAQRWPEIATRLGLTAGEPDEWLAVARNLYTGLDPRTGLIEQFQGYFGLEDIDLAALEPRTAPIDVLLGRERIARSRIIKQPDVVMLLHLLWDRFPAEVREANFRYYDPRTAHGSSLSPPIHAAVAARLGDLELAERYFRQTAEIDLANNMGNAAGGVHIAALGGLWQAAVFGFAGLDVTAQGPRLQPQLPARWRGLRLAIRWRGQPYPIDLTREPRSPTAGEELHP